MKVIWVYQNLKGKYAEALNRLECLMLIASANLWKRLYPDDTRYFYCDNTTGKLIKSLGVPYLFDKVVELPSMEELQVDTSVFWSIAKLRVLSEQEEPVILMDHDFLALSPIKDFLDPNKICYCNRENAVNYYPNNLDPYVQDLSFKVRWPDTAVNVGFLYLPDPEFTQMYAGISLQLMEEFTKMKVPNSKYLIFAEQLSLSYLIQDKPHQALIKDIWECSRNQWNPTKIDETGIWTVKDSSRLKFFHYGRAKKSLTPSLYEFEFNWLTEMAQEDPRVIKNIQRLKRV